MLGQYNEKRKNNGFRDNSRVYKQHLDGRRQYKLKIILATVCLIVAIGGTVAAMLVTEIWSLAAIIGFSVGVYFITILYLVKTFNYKIKKRGPMYSAEILNNPNRSSIPPPPSYPPPTLAKCRYSEEGQRASMMQWVKIETFKLEMGNNENYATLLDDGYSFDSETMGPNTCESVYSN
ncbi:hypothetical protein K502DRAFT_347035 [Neoconidiobolus thromboides FSU 785]|nr:hypothetical protein K502DRAFT_347035 [Neoconidiobolus thromboides FSU 785]